MSDLENPAPSRSAGARGWHAQPIAAIALIVVAAVATGALTSWAQGALPDQFAPLANSAGTWTVLTVLLVAATRCGPVLGGVLGLLAFYLLLVGYALAAAAQGLSYSVGPASIWAIVAIVVGPFIGVCASWLRPSTDDRLVAIGAAVISGVLIGEGVHGLTRIADTTSVGWWIGSVVVGLGVLGWTTARRLRQRASRTLAITLTAVVRGALWALYGAL